MNTLAWPLQHLPARRERWWKQSARSSGVLLLANCAFLSRYVGIGRRTCLNHQGHEPQTAIRTSSNAIVIFSSSFGLFSTTNGNSTEAIEAGLHAR